MNNEDFIKELIKTQLEINKKGVKQIKEQKQTDEEIELLWKWNEEIAEKEYWGKETTIIIVK